MTTEVLLPKLGFSVNEATITEWLAADGSSVRQGDPLYAVESEKSVQEISAPASGSLRVIRSAGETCKVGTVVAEIE